jgi:hypothetical protein
VGGPGVRGRGGRRARWIALEHLLSVDELAADRRPAPLASRTAEPPHHDDCSRHDAAFLGSWLSLNLCRARRVNTTEGEGRAKARRQGRRDEGNQQESGDGR